MAISQATRREADRDVDTRVDGIKAEFIEKIERIQDTAQPALSNSELSIGLELEVVQEGQHSRQSRIGRWVSTAPRNRRSVPDRLGRALINRLVEGKSLLCVQTQLMPGARRSVMLCESHEAERLGADWQVYNVSGGPVPDRGMIAEDIDWDDDDLWSGGAVEAKPKAKKVRKRKRTTVTVEEDTTFPEVRWQPARDGGVLRPRTLGRTPLMTSRLAMGCMRLSTDGRPERAQAIALLHRAFDSGVTMIDTADVYCTSNDDLHHNEALIAEARDCWDGDASSLVIATKGGMSRPGGRWVPSGSPEHLAEACQRSLDALQVECIDLYQLHTVDSKVPLRTSLIALRELQAAGKIRHIGLSNTNIEQIQEARELIDVASVQIRLNPFDKSAFTRGTVRYCVENDIAVLGYSPVGGHRGVGRVATDALLLELAAKHGCSPHQVTLAWLMGLGPGIVPIFGATRIESVEDSTAALGLTLDADDLDTLDARFPFTAGTRNAATRVAQRLGHALVEAERGREVVLFVGSPAAGKSTAIAPFIEQGHQRLNRDERGGTLNDLLGPLAEMLGQSDGPSVVMDNTYGTRKQRRGVFEVCARFGVPVRGIWLDTPLEEALVNASLRMLSKHGRMLDPEEIKKASREDPNTFPPAVMYRFAQMFEKPSLAEGFARLDRVEFVREIAASHQARGALFDMDGTLRKTRSGRPYPGHPDDVELLSGRKEKLAQLAAEGWTIVGISNQSGVSSGQTTVDAVEACFERTLELLELEFEVVYCPHPSGAPACWCRKPMPGMGVQLIEKYGLDRDASVFVGDMDTDRECAQALGIEFIEADDYFR